MFIFIMLLCALMVIILLIQFMLYSRSLCKELSADTSLTEESDNTPLTEECDTASDEPSCLQLALREEVTVYAPN